MAHFIDTNVILALLNDNEEHHDWCTEALAQAKRKGVVAFTDVCFAELSVAYDSPDSTKMVITPLSLERVRPSEAALYQAGQAFKLYKTDNKGPKLNVLPDYLIGAHAYAEGWPLITLNPRDFTGYFPDLEIISP